MKTGAEHLIDHMKGQNQYKAVSTSTEDSTCEDCEKLGRACSSILFIDEGTGSLDEIVEEKILNYLFELMKEKIVIFSTHRSKVLKYCNKVIQIEAYKIDIIKDEQVF